LSGKSTVLGAFVRMLGDISEGGYAATAPFSTFLRQRNEGAPRNDLARLRGARLVVALEVAEGQHFDEQLIKSVTGRDAITCRPLYKEFFTYTPQYTVWLGANTRPAIDADDPAVRRRIRVVPFPVSLKPDEVDPTVKDRLYNDPAVREALLAMLVRGALEYQRDGLGVPGVVERETLTFFAESDDIGQYLDERLEFGRGLSVTAATLRADYEDHCRATGQKPRSSQLVGKRLRDRGAVRDDDRAHTWRGVGLRGYGESRHRGGAGEGDDHA
jgi:putative DNA primase/helicase